MDKGTKLDEGKLRYDLIPPSTLHALAQILTFGAAKYGPRNWEEGLAWGRTFGALMRHLWAWWGGEDADPETGKSHLWHAQCNLSFLIEFEQKFPELDDRPGSVDEPITQPKYREEWNPELKKFGSARWTDVIPGFVRQSHTENPQTTPTRQPTCTSPTCCHAERRLP